MSRPDDKLAAKWERILAAQGLEIIRPGTRTTKEEQDHQARTRQRSRVAKGFRRRPN